MVKAIVQDRFGAHRRAAARGGERAGGWSRRCAGRGRGGGVNAADWHLVAGLPLVMRAAFGRVEASRQSVPGLDVTGCVEAVGADVEDVAPGDEVFAGAPARSPSRACASRRSSVRAPPGFRRRRRRCPWRGARRCRAAARRAGGGEPGAHDGASGGVGQFAVQIAKARGAHVTGSAAQATSSWRVVGSVPTRWSTTAAARCRRGTGDDGLHPACRAPCGAAGRLDPDRRPR